MTVGVRVAANTAFNCDQVAVALHAVLADYVQVNPVANNFTGNL